MADDAKPKMATIAWAFIHDTAKQLRERASVLEDYIGTAETDHRVRPKPAAHDLDAIRAMLIGVSATLQILETRDLEHLRRATSDEEVRYGT